MTVAAEVILDLVLDTIREEAGDLGYEELRDPSAETALYGGEAGIDSLSLVRLIAAVERSAERRFGKPVVLADDKAMSSRNSPFRTAGTLVHLLQERLESAGA